MTTLEFVYDKLLGHNPIVVVKSGDYWLTYAGEGGELGDTIIEPNTGIAVYSKKRYARGGKAYPIAPAKTTLISGGPNFFGFSKFPRSLERPSDAIDRFKFSTVLRTIEGKIYLVGKKGKRGKKGSSVNRFISLLKEIDDVACLINRDSDLGDKPFIGGEAAIMFARQRITPYRLSWGFPKVMAAPGIQKTLTTSWGSIKQLNSYKKESNQNE